MVAGMAAQPARLRSGNGHAALPLHRSAGFAADWFPRKQDGSDLAAIARAKAGGGQIINGPMQVPGGMWIAQALDPQGAMFALLGKRA